MKLYVHLIFLLLPLGGAAVASPLQREQVAADAKWVLHADVDKLRSTVVGDYIITQLLDAKLGPITRQFDLELDWKKVNALTAYGASFESAASFNGVLLLNTELDLQKPLDAAIEKASDEKQDKGVAIRKTQEGDVMIYSLKGGLFASFKPGRPVIVGKSLDSIQRASDVIAGTSPNLASTKTFSEFPKPQEPVFFMGAVEAFHSLPEVAESSKEGEALNPKAKILKLADGGRVALGEDANQLFLDLSLKAKSEDVVTQMQQVIQGMVALASLSQPDNQDLQRLAQSAKVSAAGNVVTLRIAYPADQAISFLNSNMNKHAESHKRAGKSKSKKAPSEPAKTDEQ